MTEHVGAEIWEVLVANSTNVKVFDEHSILNPDVPHRSEVALRGALWLAAQKLLEDLFADATAMRAAKDAPEAVATETRLLQSLPENYRGAYDAAFARNFLIAAVDLTSRLSSGWRRLGCTAQEFGLSFLLDEVQALENLYELELPGEWRDYLEDFFYEDTDFLAHHTIGQDGYVDSIYELSPVERWFQPFNNETALPPFLH